MTQRALFLHGGPGLSDYLDGLDRELDGVFDIERYTQPQLHDVPAFVADVVGRLSEPAWLVGHSWGGRLAFETAAAAPDRVLGIVAVGSLGALGQGGWNLLGDRILARLTDDERSRAETATGIAGLRLVWPAYFASREAAAPFPSTLEAYPDVLEAIYEWIAEHSDGPSTAAALARFERPVLALHGSEDVAPLEGMAETIACFPDGHLLILDGVGHFPWLERPGSVRESVVDFLATRSS